MNQTRAIQESLKEGKVETIRETFLKVRSLMTYDDEISLKRIWFDSIAVVIGDACIAQARISAMHGAGSQNSIAWYKLGNQH